MYRAEIIANQSVQDDIIEVLEENIPGILYTTVPLVTGRGKSSYKLGTATWPETNFLMISYIEDEEKAAVKKIIAAVKEKFPDEGIKVFFVKSE
ncbi:PG0541 family transporter-associated protein [Treponema sp.]|uniref:PG0541 family transporter-associated protein n=1 Tax=Treponema sp. TaxID=166 RepID=UPI00257A5954|nr:PG0541 family transporter-associated protein [Treponema sp.]MBE6355456.1 hypothetical protein [Treponema sp.]